MKRRKIDAPHSPTTTLVSQFSFLNTNNTDTRMLNLTNAMQQVSVESPSSSHSISMGSVDSPCTPPKDAEKMEQQPTTPRQAKRSRSQANRGPVSPLPFLERPSAPNRDSRRENIQPGSPYAVSGKIMRLPTNTPAASARISRQIINQFDESPDTNPNTLIRQFGC